MPYRLSSLAEHDLDEIWLYIADAAGVETADRLTDTIVERFAMLAAHPKIGIARPEFGPGTRRFAIDSYLIYYREEPQHLLVSRVVHGSRDQPDVWSQSSGSGS